jgi:hypothetical protein
MAHLHVYFEATEEVPWVALIIKLSLINNLQVPERT